MNNFERFLGAVQHWLAKFNLQEWDVSVSEEPLGIDAAQARVHIYAMDRAVDLVWNSDCPDDMGAITPEGVALHEVLHILLASMRDPKEKRSNWQYAAEHAVINRLVRFIESTKTSQISEEHY